MMEQEIKNLNFESVSILRPSLIIGPRKEKKIRRKNGNYFHENNESFAIWKVEKLSNHTSPTKRKNIGNCHTKK